MNTCKFFLQGTCKFGDNCKFSHQIPETVPTQGGSISIMRQNSKPPTIDTNVLIKSVITDMTNAEKGSHWLLSSYAPFKDKPCFPGFENQSFEEVRQGYYEGMKNGTVEQFKQQLQVALQDAAMKMKALQNPSNEIVSIIVQIYNTPVANQNVSGNQFTSQQPSSIFGQNQAMYPQNQQQTPSVFAAANQSLFRNTPNQQQSVFGSTPTNTQQQSMFANSSQNTNIFAGNLQQNKNAFGGQSLFGNQQNFANTSNAPFGSPNTGNSPFGGQSTTKPQNNTFGGQILSSESSVFGGQNTQSGPFGGHSSTGQNSLFGSAQNTLFGGGQNAINTQSGPFGGGQNILSTQSAPFGGGQNVISTQSTPFGGGQTVISTQSTPFGGGQNVISTQSTPFGAGQNVISTQSTPFGGGQNVMSTQSGPFGGGQNGASTQSTPFGGGQNVASTQSTPFGGGQNVPISQNSPFVGAQNSIFGQQSNAFTSPFQNQNTGGNLFGNQTQTNAPSVFNSQSQQSEQSTIVATTTSPFGAPIQQQQSIMAATTSPFGAPSQQQQSLFGASSLQQQPTPQSTPAFQTQQQPNIFAAAAQSLFGGQSTIFNPSASTEQKSQNSIFGQSTVTLANSMLAGNKAEIIDSEVYSKLEDLTEDEIKSFESDSFEFGKIPEKPPTAQMCN